MSVRHDAVLSPRRSKEMRGSSLNRGSSFLFLCPLSVLQQMKKFSKGKKRALSESTRGSGHGNSNRREPILQTWSVMWPKHRTNCTKTKGTKSSGTPFQCSNYTLALVRWTAQVWYCGFLFCCIKMDALITYPDLTYFLCFSLSDKHKNCHYIQV